MLNSPPPPPPAASPPPPAKKCPKSNRELQGISVSNCLPQKDKKTRDLPNLSDCHACGGRINYTNPEERLQPLKSAWRIVLLCKKCLKMVNSGKLCSYCLKDVTVNSVSDCVKCSDCERFIHKDCVVDYSNSPPWSYACKELGLGFSGCIDCWVPKSLKNSVRDYRWKESSRKAKGKGEVCVRKGDSSGLIRKEKDAVMSFEEVVKEANSAAEKKIAVAVKAKEKALRKAVLAKNAILLASNALGLAAKKDCSNKNSEVVVSSTSNVGSGNEVARSVDDAALAIQLHRAINSSPRISRSMGLKNFNCNDLLRMTDSIIVSRKSCDPGSSEGGNVAVCSNTVPDGNHRSNLEASACVRTIVSGSAVSAPMLKGELTTYMQNNNKRKKCQENVLKTYMRNNKKREERQENVLKTYKRNNKKKEELQENVLKTYMRNNKKKEVSQENVLKTYMRNNQKMDESQENVLKTRIGNNKKREESQENVLNTRMRNNKTRKENVLKIYMRNNKKREESQGNVENGFGGTSFGVDGKCTDSDDCRIVAEPPSCQLDGLKQELNVNDARTSSLQSCKTDVVTESRSVNRRLDRYAVKYGRTTGCRRGIFEVLEEASSHSVSFQKETQASAPGFPMDCSVECKALSNSSLSTCGHVLL